MQLNPNVERDNEITLFKTEPKTLTFTITDRGQNNETLDLTNEAFENVYLKIKKDLNTEIQGTTIEVQASTVNDVGEATFNLTNQDTDLRVGVYNYTVEIELTGGGSFTAEQDTLLVKNNLFGENN